MLERLGKVGRRGVTWVQHPYDPEHYEQGTAAITGSSNNRFRWDDGLLDALNRQKSRWRDALGHSRVIPCNPDAS